MVVVSCKSGTTSIKTGDASVAQKSPDVSDKGRDRDTKKELETKPKQEKEQYEASGDYQKSQSAKSISEKTSGSPSSRQERNTQLAGSDRLNQGKKGREVSSLTTVSEADLVRKAAKEAAKGIETVKKIRICHVKNQDEWWVTLYDDVGPMIDLKQYVWDRDTETLRPFLVLKRISKNRLDSELNLNVPDRTCEIVEPPKINAPNKE